FEPMGHTSNRDIRIAKSVVDYIARWLGLTFMSGHDAIPSKPDETNRGNDIEVFSPPNTVIDGLKKDAGAAVAVAERAALLASLEDETKSNGAKGEANPLPNSGQSSQFARFQGDAPTCDNCGNITVRNGNCYLCHNCGNSMGCS
ncbi:MAG: vitamin B12-dependent ribonucleotide reductase, partial [Planctomycetota bacterium]|nr:vitamin B12-dependent ribonucleotide reductase [Planctomycetota bacterium]